MALTSDQILQLAQSLWQAEQARQPTGLPSALYPELDEADAYRIAAAKLQLRTRKSTGYKLGYTSAAMRRQMDISSPNYGVLTEDQLVGGDEQPYDELIHPLVEPEIAIRLNEDLPQAARHDRNSVLAARPEFMLAIEVCDTRYPTYRFKAVDNIADNSSAARYVLGEPVPIGPDTDLGALRIELWIDDELTDRGVGANALDDPLLAVAWLADRLGQENKCIQAGDVILTGGLTKGYLVQRGQRIATKSAGLASASVRFV